MRAKNATFFLVLLTPRLEGYYGLAMDIGKRLAQ